MKTANLRTNFFRVKSMPAAEDMIRCLMAKNHDVKVSARVTPEHDVIYGFTCVDEIPGIFLREQTPDEKLYGDFVLGVQKCIADGEQAFIVADVSAQKFNYLEGFALRVTSASFERIDTSCVPQNVIFA